jgi:hypothetical protein
LLLMAVLWLVLEFVKVLVDAFTPSSGPTTTRHSDTSRYHSAGHSTAVGYGAAGRASDPGQTAVERARAIKRTTQSLMHVTLRVAVLGRPGETVAALNATAARLAEDIASGYLQAIPDAPIGVYRAWRLDLRLRHRRAGRGFYATMPEIAALCHPPAEPLDFNMARASARNRPSQPDVPACAPCPPPRAAPSNLGGREPRHDRPPNRPLLAADCSRRAEPAGTPPAAAGRV